MVKNDKKNEKIRNIEKIDLSEFKLNNFPNVEHFEKFNNLKIVDLSNNRLKYIFPETLKTCNHLEELYLDNNLIENFKEIHKIDIIKIKILSFINNPLIKNLSRNEILKNTIFPEFKKKININNLILAKEKKYNENENFDKYWFLDKLDENDIKKFNLENLIKDYSTKKLNSKFNIKVKKDNYNNKKEILLDQCPRRYIGKFNYLIQLNYETITIFEIKNLIKKPIDKILTKNKKVINNKTKVNIKKKFVSKNSLHVKNYIKRKNKEFEEYDEKLYIPFNKRKINEKNYLKDIMQLDMINYKNRKLKKKQFNHMNIWNQNKNELEIIKDLNKKENYFVDENFNDNSEDESNSLKKIKNFGNTSINKSDLSENLSIKSINLEENFDIEVKKNEIKRKDTLLSNKNIKDFNSNNSIINNIEKKGNTRKSYLELVKLDYNKKEDLNMNDNYLKKLMNRDYGSNINPSFFSKKIKFDNFEKFKPTNNKTSNKIINQPKIENKNINSTNNISQNKQKEKTENEKLYELFIEPYKKNTFIINENKPKLNKTRKIIKKNNSKKNVNFKIDANIKHPNNLSYDYEFFEKIIEELKKENIIIKQSELLKIFEEINNISNYKDTNNFELKKRLQDNNITLREKDFINNMLYYNSIHNKNKNTEKSQWIKQRNYEKKFKTIQENVSLVKHYLKIIKFSKNKIDKNKIYNKINNLIPDIHDNDSQNNLSYKKNLIKELTFKNFKIVKSDFSIIKEEVKDLKSYNFFEHQEKVIRNKDKSYNLDMNKKLEYFNYDKEIKNFVLNMNNISSIKGNTNEEKIENYLKNYKTNYNYKKKLNYNEDYLSLKNNIEKFFKEEKINLENRFNKKHQLSLYIDKIAKN